MHCITALKKLPFRISCCGELNRVALMSTMFYLYYPLADV
jgi:hypothetical protein